MRLLNRQKPKTRKPETISPTADQARIDREIAYRKRVGQSSARLKKLREKVKTRQRKSYG